MVCSPSDRGCATDGRAVALAPFLEDCPSVLTLGVRASMADYSEEERGLLLHARRIFFPTLRYLDVFEALGKRTFPSAATYRYRRSRIAQQLLFEYLELPRPRTRVYRGMRQKARIEADFGFPVLVMGPQAVPGAQSRCIAHDRASLEEAVGRWNPVLARDAVEWRETAQFLLVRYGVAGVRRRRLLKGETGEGETAGYEPASPDSEDLREPLLMARRLVEAACLDDIVVECGYAGGLWRIIEMSRPPVRWALPDGAVLNRRRFICELIDSGHL